jgi:hypothetical protein
MRKHNPDTILPTGKFQREIGGARVLGVRGIALPGKLRFYPLIIAWTSGPF